MNMEDQAYPDEPKTGDLTKKKEKDQDQQSNDPLEAFKYKL